MDPVVHFEIPVDDAVRAKKFYPSIFGWELGEMPGMDYTDVVRPSTGAGCQLNQGRSTGA